MNSSAVALWDGNASALATKGILTPSQMMEYAVQLASRDKAQIIRAFDSEDYEMMCEFLISRTVAAIQRQLHALGTDFIGEMLGRPELADSFSIRKTLTDYEIVTLAQDLGLVSSTDGLKLKQDIELLNHITDLDPEDQEEVNIAPEDALRCARTCVTSILGKEKIQVATSFKEFRLQLESKTFKIFDSEVISLQTSPYFYKKTILNVLLTVLKNGEGAPLEHIIGNTSAILPTIWDGLRTDEKWSTGLTYSELVAKGRKTSAIGLKKALLLVNGFDFVPESLRSSSFISAANALISAHYAPGNFYSEPPLIETLANMGSTIPMPAFHRVVSATIICWIGNRWNIAFSSIPHADRILNGLSENQWTYFLNECLPHDKYILEKLANYEKPRSRWCELAGIHGLDALKVKSRTIEKLVEASASGNQLAVSGHASKLLAQT